MPTAVSKSRTRIAKPAADGRVPLAKAAPPSAAASKTSGRPGRSKDLRKATERAPAGAVRPAAPSREGTKGAAILSMLQRKDGATIVEMVAATGWQAHSVRGFLSGALRKKHGFAIASDRDASGARRYRIAR